MWEMVDGRWVWVPQFRAEIEEHFANEVRRVLRIWNRGSLVLEKHMDCGFREAFVFAEREIARRIAEETNG